MINLAIAIAFVVSAFGSPGQKLLNLLISVPILQNLPAAQRGITLALANYWFPAALIYLVLRFAPYSHKFIPTHGEARALIIANIVSTLYVAARIFASTVEGGGFSYVVAIYSVVTILPALFVMGVVIIKILVRCFRKSPMTMTQHGFQRSTPAVLVVAFILGFGPVAAAMVTLVVGADSPFQKSRTTHQRMHELCKTAGETIVKIPQDVHGLFLEQDSAKSFMKIEGGVFQAWSSGIVGESLVNRKLLMFYEAPMSRRNQSPNTETGSLPYERYYTGQKKQAVADLLAEYGVFRNKLTSEGDDKLKIEGHELVIKKLSTGEVGATSRYFYNEVTREICGQQDSSARLDEESFIRRALGLN